MDSELLRIGRERLTRVFRYLEALNQHRNPVVRQVREQPWSLWFEDLPDHPSIRKGSPRSAKNTERPDGETTKGSEREEEDFVLKVERPRLTKPPEPPHDLREWLEAGWDDPAREPTVKKTRNGVDGAGSTVILDFDDNAERVFVFQAWKVEHARWARDEKPARTASRIFERLYELYGRTEREGERVELVLGDGILSWRRLEGGVYHPILLQRLQLAFDPTIPEFCLTETERPTELYSAVFQSMAEVDGRQIGKCRKELEEGNYHPLGNADTSGFLRRFVMQLSPRGEFLEDHRPEGEKEDPRIGRSAVVFLRTRTLGFAAAIEAILEDLKKRDDIPVSLLNVVGLEVGKVSEIGAEKISRTVEDDDVLLSKPANPEQIRIAQHASSAGGTLVQGPPGTGKTHTIGNLIGHLLARGKSVLVTSHTTKALRMVRKQVVSKLRPLCVSVLENDLESRKQLESAVGTIAERLSQVDVKGLEAEARQLSAMRAELQQRLSQMRARLTAARADEYRDIVISGRGWSPSEAARWVAKEAGTRAWIPGPVSPGAGIPLSDSELIELYSTNRSISAEIEKELSERLPTPTQVTSPAEFDRMIQVRLDLAKEVRDLRPDLWQAASPTPTPESLCTLSQKLSAAVEPLKGGERWRLSVAYAGKNGGSSREPWDRLLALIEQANSEIAKSQELMLRYAPKVDSGMPLEDQERISLEIQAHLRADGSLNFFVLLTRRPWKAFIESASVEGGQPKLPEHFFAISRLCRVKLLRRDLAGRWDRQMGALGAVQSHKMGPEIELSAMQFFTAIRDCLVWSTHSWAPVERELKQQGFLWEKFLSEQPMGIGSDGEMRRLHQAVSVGLPPMLSSRANFLAWEQNERLLRGLEEVVSLAKAMAGDSETVAELYDSVLARNPEAYRAAFARLSELHAAKSELARRNELLQRLESAAPGWTRSVRSRVGVHGQSVMPEDVAGAWTWRQLHDELELRAKTSLEEIQGGIDQCRQQLQAITIDLIDRLAWGFQARRTSVPQKQALVGWLDTIRKIGKGKGEPTRVSRLRREAAQLMTKCRGSVPVWVMPLSRVVENFDPRETRFDVVIVDEASQSDVMALAAIYLGASVVVVGDHEQVSPSAVGQEMAVVQSLIGQFLHGIPNSHLYEGTTSVYDLARQSFGETIRLVEHFRCATEIIQFSKDLSYDGAIKPLRDTSRVALRPHTVAYRVEGASRDGKVNRQEAEVIASLAAAALEQPEYEKNDFDEVTSFGVVSLVGEDQVLEIDRLLQGCIPPDKYEKHRFLCGTSAQFQGDERDVMFISMVDAPAGGPLAFRDQQMFKQRYNVAASRARDQMWLVHSLNARSDLRPGDLRRRLIEHAEDPNILLRQMEDKEERVESPFEREVLRRLLAAGYCVTPQWKVGARRIDLVVEDGNRRLAVECDGDRYHPVEKLGEDMERQATLERMGWRFVRIRGSVFFRDPGRAMAPVFQRLQDLEISPTFTQGKPVERALSTELSERVIRRAEQIRSAWKAQHEEELQSGKG